MDQAEFVVSEGPVVLSEQDATAATSVASALPIETKPVELTKPVENGQSDTPASPVLPATTEDAQVKPVVETATHFVPASPAINADVVNSLQPSIEKSVDVRSEETAAKPQSESLDKVPGKLDWLIDWLIDGLIDWLIDWLMGWLIDWLIDYWLSNCCCFV